MHNAHSHVYIAAMRDAPGDANDESRRPSASTKSAGLDARESLPPGTVLVAATPSPDSTLSPEEMEALEMLEDELRSECIRIADGQGPRTPEEILAKCLVATRLHLEKEAAVAARREPAPAARHGKKKTAAEVTRADDSDIIMADPESSGAEDGLAAPAARQSDEIMASPSPPPAPWRADAPTPEIAEDDEQIADGDAQEDDAAASPGWQVPKHTFRPDAMAAWLAGAHAVEEEDAPSEGDDEERGDDEDDASAILTGPQDLLRLGKRGREPSPSPSPERQLPASKRARANKPQSPRADWPSLPRSEAPRPPDAVHPRSLLNRPRGQPGGAPERRDGASQRPNGKENRPPSAAGGPASLALSWDAVIAAPRPTAPPPPPQPRRAAAADDGAAPETPLAAVFAPADPTLKITTPPKGGFPSPIGRVGKHPFDNVREEQLARWNALRQGVLIAIAHGRGVLGHLVDSSFTPVASTLTSTMRRYTGKDDIVVSAPRPISPPTSVDAAPHCLLISNLDEEDVARLRELGTLSTSAVTVSFLAMDERRPRFLCSVDGYTTTAVLEVRDLILQRLQQEEMAIRALQVAAQIPQYRKLSVYNAFAAITATLTVQLLDVKARGNVPTPIFNIYADLPTDDLAVWEEWRQVLLSVDYHDDFLGLGTLRSFPSCSLCHSDDHFRGLCPFPRVSGWQGPTAPPRRRPLQPRNRQ